MLHTSRRDRLLHSQVEVRVSTAPGKALCQCVGCVRQNGRRRDANCSCLTDQNDHCERGTCALMSAVSRYAEDRDGLVLVRKSIFGRL